MGNNFTIKGSLKISPELRRHLQWHKAQVTREYEVQVLGKRNKPIRGGQVKIGGETFLTDSRGKVKFSLVFNETNYLESRELEVAQADKIIAKRGIR